jgi:hypothetical protein
MSTRCTIHFTDGGSEGHSEAIIYRHSDGYPDCILPDLEDFFKAVEDQCGRDTRFNDPSYLASKYVVWLAGQFTRRFEQLPDGSYASVEHPETPLNFLSVGVVQSDPGDIEYRYRVQCPSSGRPTVTHEELGGDDN